MNELLEIVKNKIENNFQDAIVYVEMNADFPVFIIQKKQLKTVLQFLKQDTDLQFQFLTTMCGIHFPDNKPENEFALMYQLHNLPKNWRIRIKTFMPKSDLDMPTVTDVFPAANWMEREAFDFYGFNFIGHPNMTRILNMDEMNYHPLRKEYPLEDLGRIDKDDKMFGR